MIAALLLLAAGAVPQPVAKAERAFAAMAQEKGQWTAFRAFMAPRAIRLTPDVTPAAQVLAGLSDPPHAIQWRPDRTITACDGSLAFSTGPWTLNGATGRFYTIWQRQPDGAWKWLFDGGVSDKTPAAPDSKLEELRADCGRLPADDAPAAKVGGIAADRSFSWGLFRLPEPGKRVLRVRFVRAGHWTPAVNVILE